MKKLTSFTILTCLLLLFGFQESSGQTSSGLVNSSNVLRLPFSSGTSMTASTSYSNPANPKMGQLSLKTYSGGTEPISSPGSGMVLELARPISYCDSYPPCPGEEGMIIELGLEYLIIYGLDPTTIAASGLQIGSRVSAGQYLGNLSASHNFHMEIYVPDVPGQLFDASGMLIRNWVTVTEGRKTYTYDTHNRIPVICDRSWNGPLYDGQVLTQAGCTSRKTIDHKDITPELSIYPQPASQQLTFEMQGADAQNGSLVLMDIHGRMVGTFQSTGNTITIDVENLNSGMYLYQFSNAQVQKAGKVMIAK